ncbi:hypothetical protein PILCRDRAFT_736627 [Piloderma croceum F 1598]|uniref:Uncharacterized protein n=1 Tax=Piloderma croceum (strain F 1598) TaxID=765440 RepID=A0A0C3AG84_PILCF|nr:hypothetical protein PILCRDRAFT_736627 [Piloderma croceum F 1598]
MSASLERIRSFRCRGLPEIKIYTAEIAPVSSRRNSQASLTQFGPFSFSWPRCRACRREAYT